MKQIIKLILLYQKIVSPYVKTQCRFYPTCSTYSILAIKRYGSLIGILKTFLRIVRCHPFSRGGVDFP
ncbi:MAG: membrane protein insertion efficiency factor YidD [Alphaproteobacteria bacterium]|nr:membrane protein insertion efficiency factor YidD [Alphaproteobacteria bacterium]